jgi:pimeloyl-ACP methyl ester carboxylesterase
MHSNAAHDHSHAGYSVMMASYDDALQRLRVPYESLTVPTRFGATHLIATGPRDRPPLVLLHGGIGNALSWRSQLTRFSRMYRVYAPDVIGQPGKSAPVRPDFNGPGYAQWLEDVLDALQIEQANFAGISCGGWLILKLATCAPYRIARAVLMSSAGFVPPTASVIGRLLILSLIPSDKNIRQFLRLMTSPRAKIDDKMVAEFSVLLNHFKTTAIPPCVPDEDLRLLSAPTLLLMGKHERIFKPQAVIARARALLPNLRAAEIIPNAGHIIQSPVMNGRIMRFLAEAEITG